ncbi:hypothetical protein KJ840_00995 [Patescibacteria group bacterium]|nr:hypothetical protein [Patescibacteria group bacterium]
MKKYMSGFVPINFNLVGKVLLPLGIIFLLSKIISYFTKWFNIPNVLLFMGIGFIIIGLYLIFVAPKE